MLISDLLQLWPVDFTDKVKINTYIKNKTAIQSPSQSQCDIRNNPFHYTCFIMHAKVSETTFCFSCISSRFILANIVK